MENANLSNQVLQYVMAVTDRKFAALSVSTLAYFFKINRFTLTRQFKRQTGMTLEEFLLKERMARAAFLLRTYQNITVKEVAEIIGFCTCNYFIRKFRQYYGVPPGKYRVLKTLPVSIPKRGYESAVIS